MKSTTTFHGVIHGKLIELVDDPGLCEGQQVEVTLRAAPAARTWGDGLRRAAGRLADSWTSDDDEILERLRYDRLQSGGRELPT